MSNVVTLKVIMERGAFIGGCSCNYYNMEGKDSLSQELENSQRQNNIEVIDEILEALEQRYGERLKIKVADPRHVLTFWDDIRFRVRTATPAWILNRKKFCDGVPTLAALQNAIDASVKN